jgi:Tol biopolymer transport system component
MIIIARQDGLPRVPGGTFLLGMPPFALVVTTTERTWRIQPEPQQPSASDNAPIYPSLSRDGRLVACARIKSYSPSRMAIATYSLPENTWTEFVIIDHAFGVSLSFDSSKIAFISRDTPSDLPRLHVLNTTTRVDRIIPVRGRVSIRSRPSWSPDGKSIAYQVDTSVRLEDKGEAEIDIVELGTGEARRLSRGQSPSWSPSGDWIAYLDISEGATAIGAGKPEYFPARCLASHPDATATRPLFPSSRRKHFFVGAPVWSPDSRELYLNEIVDLENLNTDIDKLDFATQKVTKRFKRVPRLLDLASQSQLPRV